MSLPYFPMYPSDFEAKTSHLTMAEDGAYNRLIRICWMTPGCTIPADESWIMRRARARSDEEQDAVRAVLAEFFTVENGRYSNARITKEWLAANEAHERRKNAGSKGGKAKALKTKETAPSNAVAKPKQPEPEPEPVKKEEGKPSSKKERGSRLPDDWRLPRDWGEWAVTEGMDEISVRREADRFKDWWISVSGAKGVKLNWQATWRNWVRKAIDDRKRTSKPAPKPGHVNAGAFGNIPERC